MSCVSLVPLRHGFLGERVELRAEGGRGYKKCLGDLTGEERVPTLTFAKNQEKIERLRGKRKPGRSRLKKTHLSG